MTARFWVGISTGFVLALASGCGQPCKDAQTNILTPTQAVQAYLVANPTGAELASGGCAMILDQFKNIPNGAKTIRDIANGKFSEDHSDCVQWQDGSRYVCDGGYAYGPNYLAASSTERPPYGGPHGPGPGPHPPAQPIPGPGPQPQPYCYWEHYTYCSQYNYYTTHDEPAYSDAIELSKNLDILFANTQHMCSEAMGGNPDQAYSESQDLNKFLRDSAVPEENTVYAYACPAGK